MAYEWLCLIELYCNNYCLLTRLSSIYLIRPSIIFRFSNFKNCYIYCSSLFLFSYELLCKRDFFSSACFLFLDIFAFCCSHYLTFCTNSFFISSSYFWLFTFSCWDIIFLLGLLFLSEGDAGSFSIILISRS